MKIFYTYNQCQLDAVVKFIEKNHNWFNMIDNAAPIIQSQILEGLEKVAKGFPNMNYYSSSGFYLIPQLITVENYDSDYNEIYINIVVDLSSHTFKYNYIKNSVIITSTNKENKNEP